MKRPRRRELLEALELIARRGCEISTTGPGSCSRPGNGRVFPSDHSGGSYREMCYPCIARAALVGEWKAEKARVAALPEYLP